jgi:hypothetical protein
VTEAEWEAAVVADGEDVDDARRDLDAIARALPAAALRTIGISRAAAVRRIQRDLAGPPATTKSLRKVAAIFGLTVCGGAAKTETLTASDTLEVYVTEPPAPVSARTSAVRRTGRLIRQARAGPLALRFQDSA